MATIKVADHNEPNLPDGYLTLVATQKVKKKPKELLFTAPPAKITISVRGPQFSLSPQDVVSVYPPPGAAGHYEKVMPQIILASGTLPWERSPSVSGKAGAPPRPWLALIVLHKDDHDLTDQTGSLGLASPDGIYTVQVGDPSLDRFHAPWRKGAPNDAGMARVMKLGGARKRIASVRGRPRQARARPQ
jgi:hypothetical protein